MKQRAIPCIMMRGGTSRGPYFNRADLPENLDDLARVLIAVMGAGSPLQVDGIGGGQPTTSKVAMLSPSTQPEIDIDYFFAQVHHQRAEVDFYPNCGNILAGVGAAAIEMGLIVVTGEHTPVTIYNTNSQSYVDTMVHTPQGSVNYEGDTRIDGVPGSAAAAILNFNNVVGSKTGALFPTQHACNLFNGITVSCMDAAVPMVIGKAEDFGISGYETREQLDGNANLFARIESIRVQAGKAMGLGDVSTSVLPKFALLAPAMQGGTIAVRYFTPWRTHPTLAVTGSICVGACVLAPDSIATGMVTLPANQQPTSIHIEHPLGSLAVAISYRLTTDGFSIQQAGVIRTARKLFEGTVMVPHSA